jgi:hypothetical protein
MEVFVQLSSLQNEEMEYRRFLFKVAADGDVRAQQQLEREYHLRVRPKNNKSNRVKGKKAATERH